MGLAGLFIGLIGVLLFRIRNTDKLFLNTISGLVVIILSSDLLDSYLYYGLIISTGAGGLLVIFYLIRFVKKNKRGTIDYLKLIAIILISVYPLTSIFNIPYLSEILNFMCIPFSFIIYTYDRFVLKPDPMKKKFIIILTVQTVLVALFLVFAYVQKLEADKQRDFAVKQEQLANEQLMPMNKEIEKLRVEIENCR